MLLNRTKYLASIYFFSSKFIVYAQILVRFFEYFRNKKTNFLTMQSIGNLRKRRCPWTRFAQARFGLLQLS